MALPRDASNQAIDGHNVLDVTSSSTEARLRALDAMLGGVAHDLNNALSVVLMNLDVMQQDTALTGKHARRINGMLDAMTRASILVRHLLNFSHARRPEPEVVSVAEVIESLVELLQVAVGKEIAIAVEAADNVGPCCVIVDQATFEVGFIHAALQLAATMPGGGALTFRLGASDPGDEVVLALETTPREAGTGAKAYRTLDIALLETLTRDAHGRVSAMAETANACGLAIHLPACSESTTV